MNRFKLLVVAIALILAGILLGQNRQGISLKLFCPDASSPDCLYLSPEQPLAIWIAIFVFLGIVSSLLWQSLARLAAPSLRVSKPNNSNAARDKVRDFPTREPVRDRNVRNSRPQTTSTSNSSYSDWEQPRSEDWETERANVRPSTSSTSDTSSERNEKSTSEKPIQDSFVSQPRNTNSVDSAYSFNFSKDRKKSDEKLSDKDGNVDAVYDATYRTVSPPQSERSNEDRDDEEWI